MSASLIPTRSARPSPLTSPSRLPTVLWSARADHWTLGRLEGGAGGERDRDVGVVDRHEVGSAVAVDVADVVGGGAVEGHVGPSGGWVEVPVEVIAHMSPAFWAMRSARPLPSMSPMVVKDTLAHRVGELNDVPVEVITQGVAGDEVGSAETVHVADAVGDGAVEKHVAAPRRAE